MCTHFITIETSDIKTAKYLNIGNIQQLRASLLNKLLLRPEGRKNYRNIC